eukprot:gene452-831_t
MGAHSEGLLSGRLPHNTGLWSNTPVHGAMAWFAQYENVTFARHLQDAGYHTFLAGKYMNGYGKRPTHVPVGWDDWRGFNHVTYNNPGVSVQGQPANVSGYSTDIIRRYARDFLDGHATSDKPFFMYLSPKAPHAPWTPAKRHSSLYRSIKVQHQSPIFRTRHPHDIDSCEIPSSRAAA